MAVHATHCEVTAEVDLWVHRDATSDLPSGARGVLEDVPEVRTVEVTDVTDVTPRSTDIRVTVTARVALADDPSGRGAAAATLEDGFGVVDASVEAVDRTGD